MLKPPFHDPHRPPLLPVQPQPPTHHAQRSSSNSNLDVDSSSSDADSEDLSDVEEHVARAPLSPPRLVTPVPHFPIHFAEAQAQAGRGSALGAAPVDGGIFQGGGGGDLESFGGFDFGGYGSSVGAVGGAELLSLVGGAGNGSESDGVIRDGGEWGMGGSSSGLELGDLGDLDRQGWQVSLSPNDLSRKLS